MWLPRRAALLSSVVVLGACAPKPGGPYPDAPVVLVSIDTLRADHLALYGYRAGSTPVFDGLAREGTVFDDVYSHVPLTLPAHASLLTGLLPPRHEVRDNMGFRLKETHATLATRFKAAGFATGGAISAYVLRSQTGIARGFDFYEDALTIDAATGSLGDLQRDGAVAVDALARWVEGLGGKRFFAFLHLYEPHSPYTPPAKYKSLPLAYDGEVAYADELVGRFLERLRASSLYDRAIIAVTSDHGEGLKDHGEEEHGIFLYREVVHVPLVLRLPRGVGAGRRVEGPIAQVDIPATLLDLAGVPGPGLDGISLAPALASGRASARPVYSETLFPRYHFGWSETYAASESRFRFIKAPRPELYDLDKDPGEKQNLAPGRPAAVTSMGNWLSGQIGGVTAREEVDADTREKLAALGYVSGGTATATAGDLPDPKDKIATYENWKQALSLRRDGRDAEAVAQLQKVVAENPLMTDAWLTLGLALIKVDRNREGMAALDKVIEIDPTHSEAHLALAKLYAFDHKLDLAVKHAEIATGREPGKSYEVLAQLMMDAKRPQDAATFARKSLAADPQRMMSHFVLGMIARQQGRCEEALGSFRRAEEALSRETHSVLRNLHLNMGDCLARLGREAEAEKEFLAELQALPRSRDARVGLAMLYRSQGRDKEARAVLADLVEKDPQADAYWAVVRTFSVLGDAEAARAFAEKARARFPADPRFR